MDISSDPGLIAGICVFCVFAATVIGCGIWRRQRTQHRADTHPSPAYQRILAEREARLNQEVAKRRAEEQAAGLGTPVWFSRYMHNGALRHWVLVIDDTKYELRRADDGGRGYTYHIAPGSIDHEKRQAALAATKFPTVDGYYVCLIGWTDLRADQLRAIAADVLAAFGSYNLLWNNCQDFLQRFADRIIRHRALDWAWFRDHARTEYQHDQKVPPPPEAVLAAQQANLQMQAQMAQNQLQQQTVMNNIQMNSMLLSTQMQTSIAMQNSINNPPMNPPIMMGGGGA